MKFASTRSFVPIRFSAPIGLSETTWFSGATDKYPIDLTLRVQLVLRDRAVFAVFDVVQATATCRTLPAASRGMRTSRTPASRRAVMSAVRKPEVSGTTRRKPPKRTSEWRIVCPSARRGARLPVMTSIPPSRCTSIRSRGVPGISTQTSISLALSWIDTGGVHVAPLATEVGGTEQPEEPVHLLLHVLHGIPLRRDGCVRRVGRGDIPARHGAVQRANVTDGFIELHVGSHLPSSFACEAAPLCTGRTCDGSTRQAEMPADWGRRRKRRRVPSRHGASCDRTFARGAEDTAWRSCKPTHWMGTTKVPASGSQSTGGRQSAVLVHGAQVPPRHAGAAPQQSSHVVLLEPGDALERGVPATKESSFGPEASETVRPFGVDVVIDERRDGSVDVNRHGTADVSVASGASAAIVGRRTECVDLHGDRARAAAAYGPPGNSCK